jgi:F-type H+-transporting ATPase subunit delta
MAELSTVRRYVHALFNAASKSGQLDQVEEDLRSINQTLVAVPRLETVLRAPTIGGERKKQLLAHTFGNRVSPLTLRFLNLLIDRRRETILHDTYREYVRLANEKRNILLVEVTAATILADDERASLAAALSRRTGKQVVLQVHQDTTIIGGLVLRMGDTILDGSVRSRLEQLRQRLTSGAPLA